ncbi:MAG: hypothetical protein HFJ50_01655 [Clostridia bacterium]|jgi:hypothetical protein|nr:hypothetical protein [Clostridia bacterium]
MSARREKEVKKKKKRGFSIYTLLVLICIAIILGSAYVLLDKQGIDIAEYLPIDEVKEFFANLGSEDDDKEEKKNEKDNNTTVTKKETTGANMANKEDVLKTPDENVQTDKPENTPDPTTKPNSSNGSSSNGKEITEGEAKIIAKDKFESMGETNISTDELDIIKIKRKEVLYYYVASKQNTLEVRIEDGVIVRLNSEIVE